VAGGRPDLAAEESVTMVVQVNGKVRDRIEVVARHLRGGTPRRLALASAPVVEALGGAPARRVIARPPAGQRGRLTPAGDRRTT
jgi:leucyl-tRNA synthetase